MGWVWSHVPTLVIVPRFDFVLASWLLGVETKADLKSKVVISQRHVLKVRPYE